MVQFLKDAYSVKRRSNIIFLCGGNDKKHMRTCFQDYCKAHLPEYDVFLPESAMETILADGLDERFDLTDFEEFVGEMSHAIIVFPEGPGSFAETGYFSAISKLARKCILVLDTNKEKGDSFISLGPGKKIADNSIYNPNISISYTKPNFDAIAVRMKERGMPKNRKVLSLDKFSDLSPYEIAATLYSIIELCRIATVADLNYLLRAIFRNQFSAPKIKKVLSLLVGSEYLIEVGPYGHFACNPKKVQLAMVRDGYKKRGTELRLALAELYQDSDDEFQALIEDSKRAH